MTPSNSPLQSIEPSIDLHSKASGLEGRRASACVRSARSGALIFWSAIVCVDGAVLGSAGGQVQTTSRLEAEKIGALACLRWMESFGDIEISLTDKPTLLAFERDMALRSSPRSQDAWLSFGETTEVATRSLAFARSMARSVRDALSQSDHPKTTATGHRPSKSPKPALSRADALSPHAKATAKNKTKTVPLAQDILSLAGQEHPQIFFPRDLIHRILQAPRATPTPLNDDANPTTDISPSTSRGLAFMARLALGKAMRALGLDLGDPPSMPDMPDMPDMPPHQVVHLKLSTLSTAKIDDAAEPWRSVIIYTDGSYKPSRDHMGWGAVVTQNSGRSLAEAPVLALISGGAAGGSPAQAEGSAIACALESLPEHTKQVAILCDCKNIFWALRDAMRAPAAGMPARSGLDSEVLARIRAAASGRAVRFQWVKGHDGHMLNEAADILAHFGSGANIPIHPEHFAKHPRARAAGIARLIHDASSPEPLPHHPPSSASKGMRH